MGESSSSPVGRQSKTRKLIVISSRKMRSSRPGVAETTTSGETSKSPRRYADTAARRVKRKPRVSVLLTSTLKVTPPRIIVQPWADNKWRGPVVTIGSVNMRMKHNDGFQNVDGLSLLERDLWQMDAPCSVLVSMKRSPGQVATHEIVRSRRNKPRRRSVNDQSPRRLELWMTNVSRVHPVGHKNDSNISRI